MLLEKEKSCLLLVDVQEKLTPHVRHSEELVSHCHWLMRLARELEVPTLATEQYPKVLGSTVVPLQELVKHKCISKVHFSCYQEPNFVQQWRALNKEQVVIIGIETHVCVLQTAMDMSHADADVFVVVDAVSSRHDIDHKYGLKRMKQAGIHLVTREMVFFEWIKRAGTEEFKALSQSYLRD